MKSSFDNIEYLFRLTKIRQRSQSLLSSSKLPIRRNKSTDLNCYSTQPSPVIEKSVSNLQLRPDKIQLEYGINKDKKRYIQTLITNKLNHNRQYTHLKVDSLRSASDKQLPSNCSKLNVKFKWKQKILRRNQMKMIRNLLKEIKRLRRIIIESKIPKNLINLINYRENNSELTKITARNILEEKCDDTSVTMSHKFTMLNNPLDDNLENTLDDVTDFVSANSGDETIYETAWSGTVVDSAKTIVPFSSSSRKFVSVIEKQFFKVHIIYSSSDNECKDKLISPINSQINNSNLEDEVTVNSHEYFQHAQQLLNTNSSQMQNLIGGFSDSKTLNLAHKPTYDIRSYVKGNLNEPPENISFLKNKIISKSKVIKEDCKKIIPGCCKNNSGKILYEKVLSKDLKEDFESTKMILDQEKGRKANDPNSVLSRYREKRNKTRIISQADEYNKILNHAKMVKMKGDMDRKSSFDETDWSKRTDKNLDYSEDDETYVKESELGLELNVESDSENEVESLANDNNSAADSERPISKSVSFAKSPVEIKVDTNNCNNNFSVDSQYANEIKALTITINNLVRRMNNIELNFQELSTLCFSSAQNQPCHNCGSNPYYQ